MKKLVLTIIVLSIGAFGFFWYGPSVTTEDGAEFTIIIVDEFDVIIYQETHVASEDDTLFEIMDETFSVSCANASYQPSTCDTTPLFGTILLGIDDLETDWSTDYIAIYINDEYSNYGIDQISINDGDVFRFEYTLVEEVSP